MQIFSYNYDSKTFFENIWANRGEGGWRKGEECQIENPKNTENFLFVCDEKYRVSKTLLFLRKIKAIPKSLK